MAAFISRYPKNVPGKYYVDAACTDCDLCRETAPNVFCRDDEQGISYVFRQPTTPEDVALCEESRQGCPTEAIGSDGEGFDWRSSPIRDWSRLSQTLGDSLEGLTVLTPEQERELPRTWNLRPPPPRSPEEFREMLFATFPTYRTNYKVPIYDGTPTYPIVVAAFLPFFAAEASSFTADQIHWVGSLVTDSIAEAGPLGYAFRTCLLEHPNQMNTKRLLWPYFSPNARDIVRTQSSC
jgi:ferredoxin